MPRKLDFDGISDEHHRPEGGCGSEGGCGEEEAGYRESSGKAKEAELNSLPCGSEGGGSRDTSAEVSGGVGGGVAVGVAMTADVHDAARAPPSPESSEEVVLVITSPGSTEGDSPAPSASGTRSEGASSDTGASAASHGGSDQQDTSTTLLVSGQNSGGQSPKVKERLRSVSANSAMRRSSVGSGLHPPATHDRILMEKKRRRWSLNTPNHLNNMPQVSSPCCLVKGRHITKPHSYVTYCSF